MAFPSVYGHDSLRRLRESPRTRGKAPRYEFVWGCAPIPPGVGGNLFARFLPGFQGSQPLTLIVSGGFAACAGRFP